MNPRVSRKLRATIAASALLFTPAARPAPRTAILPAAAIESHYASAAYGISFRYPGDYILKEGELKNDTDEGLGYLGPIPMEFSQPGGLRIVTLEAPKDAYPGTDFVNSFFTVSVNPSLTPDECAQFLDEQDSSARKSEKTIDSIHFRGLDVGDAGMNHQFDGTYYHGFSAGVCYELGYGIATAGFGAVDGITQVDGGEVASILERILQSVAIHPPKSATSPASIALASPAIQNFSAAPLPLPAPPNTYRASWDVKNAQASQISLSSICPGDVAILTVTAAGAEGASFPCNAVNPAPSATGSLDLEFQNRTGAPIEIPLRLFAAVGASSISKSLTVSLPPLPIIVVISQDGGRHVLPGNSSPAPIEILAGRTVQISGLAFLPKDILWIGESSLPVESLDGKNITFIVPTNFPAGQFSLSVTNDHGRSNSATVRILTPKPQLAIYNYQPKIKCNGGGVVYAPNSYGFKARCIGHGGFPYPPCSDAPINLAQFPIEWREERCEPDNAWYGMRGFALLRFNAAQLTIDYIDQAAAITHSETL